MEIKGALALLFAPNAGEPGRLLEGQMHMLRVLLPRAPRWLTIVRVASITALVCLVAGPLAAFATALSPNHGAAPIILLLVLVAALMAWLVRMAALFLLFRDVMQHPMLGEAAREALRAKKPSGASTKGRAGAVDRAAPAPASASKAPASEPVVDEPQPPKNLALKTKRRSRRR